MIRFLDEHNGNATADKLKSELMKVIKTGESYFNPPEFKDKKGKTAKQQMDEFQTNCAKKFQTAAQKFYTSYMTANRKDYKAERERAMKYFGIPELHPDKRNIKGNTGDKGDKAKNNPAVYLPKRGPKYRAMIDAAMEYETYADDEQPDPVKKMKLIDSILDYQKGKKKVMSGDARHRFNNSMALLASVTLGTPMEKYLDSQIAHVNKIRGAKPGSKDFLTKEGIFEGFKANKQADAQVKQNEPEKDPEAQIQGPQG